MGIALSTAGITLNYAVGTTADTRPTTGYKNVPDVKEIPELNPAPETLETTDLSATEYKTYIAGLKDLGGALAFKANLTELGKTAWEAMMTEYKAAKAAGKPMWWFIDIPGLTEGVFFTGEPSAMGLPGAGVSAVLETSLYITPTNEPTWDAKPTAGGGA